MRKIKKPFLAKGILNLGEGVFGGVLLYNINLGGCVVFYLPICSAQIGVRFYS